MANSTATSYRFSLLLGETWLLIAFVLATQQREVSKAGIQPDFDSSPCGHNVGTWWSGANLGFIKAKDGLHNLQAHKIYTIKINIVVTTCKIRTTKKTLLTGITEEFHSKN